MLCQFSRGYILYRDYTLEVGQFASIDKNAKLPYLENVANPYWPNTGETGKPTGLKDGGKLAFQGYRISFNIRFYHPVMIFDSNMKYPCD